MLRIVTLCVFWVVILAACLFQPAGTLAWPMAWAFLVVYVAFVVLTFFVLDADLLLDRGGWKHGFKSWDPPLAAVGFLFLCPVSLVVAGYDVMRFGWSPGIPLVLKIFFLSVFVLGYSFALWAMSVNRFFVKFVRIQYDRGHHVVNRGPYGYVRHPGYAGAILAHLVLPMALGSLWALVPACFGGALFIMRTWLEDRTLQRELPGYRDYVEEVRWRLAPGVW